MASFLKLPNELILLIAENLHSQSAINALCQTSRRMYNLVFPYLCRYNCEYDRFCAIGIAVEKGNIEALRLLLQEEKNMPSEIRQPWRDSQLWEDRPDLPACGLLPSNPIKTAALQGYEDIMSVLLDAGADPNYDAVGDDAILLAVQNQHLGVLKVLLNPATPGIRLEKIQLESAAFRAVEKANAEMLELLLERIEEADDYRLGKFQELLYKISTYGAWFGHAAVVDVAMKMDPLPDPEDWIWFGQQWLTEAVVDGFHDVVKVLLDHGVPPDVESERGCTALALATGTGATIIAKLLLDAGADPDAQRCNGMPAVSCRHCLALPPKFPGFC